MSKTYYVYILGNSRPTLYIGVTNNLVRRVWEHKKGLVDGFTKKYGLKKLLYFEQFSYVEDAIRREKQLKHWNRKWKLDLIKKTNPEFRDLYASIISWFSIPLRRVEDEASKSRMTRFFLCHSRESENLDPQSSWGWHKEERFSIRSRMTQKGELFHVRNIWVCFK